jgi:hypothetical protein
MEISHETVVMGDSGHPLIMQARREAEAAAFEA